MAVTKKQAVAKPKFHTYVSDFTMYFGPLAMRGSMVSLRKPKSATKVEYRMVSPGDGNSVEQKYIDLVTGKQYSADECDRVAITADDEVTTIDNDTLKQIKVSALTKNTVTLTVHKAEDIDKSLWHSDSNDYIFVPSAGDSKNAAVAEAFIAAVVNSPDKALLGLCNLSGHEGLFRLTVWRGNLIFQKQLYPHEVNEHTEIEHPVTNDAKMIMKVFGSKLQDYDPSVYRDNVVDRQRQILENPALLNEFEIETPSDSDISDLLSGLEEWGD